MTGSQDQKQSQKLALIAEALIGTNQEEKRYRVKTTGRVDGKKMARYSIYLNNKKEAEELAKRYKSFILKLKHQVVAENG